MAAAPVAVFDSGLGSLSVVRRLRRAAPGVPIVYLADEENYPYGTRGPAELRRIIGGRIRLLSDMFSPSLVVVGSITPTLLLPDLFGGPVLGVEPPLRAAAEATRTGCVGVLATRSVVASGRIGALARRLGLPAAVRLCPIDASPLVDLVESGAFLDDDAACARRIGALAPLLRRGIGGRGIDSVALSSTHLPFLSGRLAAAFPHVRFAEPGDDIARAVQERIAAAPGAAPSAARGPPAPPPPLRVLTSGRDPERLGRRLRRLGVPERVVPLGAA